MIKLISIFLLLSASLSFCEELPKDYKVLRTLWVKKKKDLDKQYVEALKHLKVKYTKKADLEIALKIDKEIKSFNFEDEKSHPVKSIPKIEDVIVGKWITKSSRGWKGISEFLPNGKFPGEGKGKWVIKNNGKELFCDWGNGTGDTFYLPPVNGVMRGRSSRGVAMTATKIKNQ